MRVPLMNKAQAIHKFWSSFGLPAFDPNTVPDNETAQMPYITYEMKSDNIGNEVALNASLWYRSTSWEEITLKSEEIAAEIQKISPVKIDGGYCWIKRGSPFSQRMSDEDDSVRRILINITVEYLTEI